MKFYFELGNGLDSTYLTNYVCTYAKFFKTVK